MTIDASLNDRLRRIVRRHKKMKTNGVVHVVGSDGLIRTRPRLIRPQFPIRGAMLVVAMLILFKSVLYAQVGSLAYEARVDALRGGTWLDQAGAVVLQIEPVTEAVGQFLKPYLFQKN